MRYMMIVLGPENLSAAGPPPAELIEEIGKRIGEAMQSGKIVSFGGLHPTSSGARVSISNGELFTTDGPFTESKEVIGGYSVYNVASKEEALQIARENMELHRRYWPNWEGTIELRRMFEEEDDVREAQIEGSRVASSAT